jgi:iron complex outermembrane receptor protein
MWGEHWRTDASLTAMRAVFGPTLPPVDLNRNRMPAIPDRLGLLGAHWSQTGWVGAKPSPGWQASVEWLGRSKLWANDTNTQAASGYGTVNLRLRYRQPLAGGTLEPFLMIDNASNKSVVGSVIVNQTSGASFEPALPRTWTLGLQAKWAL